MPTAVNRDEVQQLLASRAQLVDVLSADEYAAEHVPGAINFPLKQRTRETTVQLDRDRPVIACCHDYQ